MRRSPSPSEFARTGFPRFIEVLGPPGSGKSTFITTAISSFGNRVFVDLDQALSRTFKQSSGARRFATSWARLFSAIKVESGDGGADKRFQRSTVYLDALTEFIAANLEYTMSAIASIQHIADKSERQQVLRWIFKLYAKYQYVDASFREECAVLIDEGFFGRINTLFTYRSPVPVPEEIRNYVRLSPKPAGVVLLEADLDVCRDRIDARPKGPPKRFGPLPPEERERILSVSKEYIEIAASELLAMDVPVIRVDSILPPEEQVRIAISSLGRLGILPAQVSADRRQAD